MTGFILWIVVIGSGYATTTSQQAALFPTQQACEGAKSLFLAEVATRRQLNAVAVCLPRSMSPESEPFIGSSTPLEK